MGTEGYRVGCPGSRRRPVLLARGAWSSSGSGGRRCASSSGRGSWVATAAGQGHPPAGPEAGDRGRRLVEPDIPLQGTPAGEQAAQAADLHLVDGAASAPRPGPGGARTRSPSSGRERRRPERGDELRRAPPRRTAPARSTSARNRRSDSRARRGPLAPPRPSRSVQRSAMRTRSASCPRALSRCLTRSVPKCTATCSARSSGEGRRWAGARVARRGLGSRGRRVHVGSIDRTGAGAARRSPRRRRRMSWKWWCHRARRSTSSRLEAGPVDLVAEALGDERVGPPELGRGHEQVEVDHHPQPRVGVHPASTSAAPLRSMTGMPSASSSARIRSSSCWSITLRAVDSPCVLAELGDDLRRHVDVGGGVAEVVPEQRSEPVPAGQLEHDAVPRHRRRRTHRQRAAAARRRRRAAPPRVRRSGRARCQPASPADPSSTR